MQNTPRLSVGLPRNCNVLNPGTKNIISSKDNNPAPTSYNHSSDNINFKKQRSSLYFKERKFFSPKNMAAIKEVLPV